VRNMKKRVRNANICHMRQLSDCHAMHRAGTSVFQPDIEETTMIDKSGSNGTIWKLENLPKAEVLRILFDRDSMPAA
jgi:hypothetical protein